jgi:hypothetical protein
MAKKAENNNARPLFTIWRYAKVIPFGFNIQPELPCKSASYKNGVPRSVPKITETALTPYIIAGQRYIKKPIG